MEILSTLLFTVFLLVAATAVLWGARLLFIKKPQDDFAVKSNDAPVVPPQATVVTLPASKPPETVKKAPAKKKTNTDVKKVLDAAADKIMASVQTPVPVKVLAKTNKNKKRTR